MATSVRRGLSAVRHNLLYSMLIAAGGFAVYRKETYFYDLIRRDLSRPSSQQQFTAQFLDGYLGKVPGLDVRPSSRRL